MISVELINFIFETDDLRLALSDPQITEYEYEIILGKDRFERLTKLANKVVELENISDIEIKDLIYIYYQGDIKNKSINNIEKDFMIKKLLE